MGAGSSKDVKSFVEALHQAATDRSVSPKEVCMAMIQLEKQKLPVRACCCVVLYFCAAGFGLTICHMLQDRWLGDNAGWQAMAAGVHNRSSSAVRYPFCLNMISQ